MKVANTRVIEREWLWRIGTCVRSFVRILAAWVGGVGGAPIVIFFSPITSKKLSTLRRRIPAMNHEFLSDRCWAYPFNEQLHGYRYKGES